ncbi:MAG: MFS transporter [Bacteroidaceae bacterium]|nr:MFS transporter [Bacteroidaceae bacterium]
MKRKHLVAIAGIIVLVAVLVSGIGQYHPQPFALQHQLESPVSLASGTQGTALAEQYGEHITMLDTAMQLRRVICIKDAEHPHDMATTLYAHGDTLYANIATIREMHITHEAIVAFGSDGQRLGVVDSCSYAVGTHYTPACLALFWHGGHLCALRTEGGSTQMVEYAAGGTRRRLHTLTDKPTLYATHLADSTQLLLIDPDFRLLCYDYTRARLRPMPRAEQQERLWHYFSLNADREFKGTLDVGYMFTPQIGTAGDTVGILCLTGGKEPALHHFGKEKSANEGNGGTAAYTQFRYTTTYVAGQTLWWCALFAFCGLILLLLYRGLRRVGLKTLGAGAVAVGLCLVIVAFYSLNIFAETKKYIGEGMTYQLNLLESVVESNYTDLIEAYTPTPQGKMLQPTGKDHRSRLDAMQNTFSQAAIYGDRDYFLCLLRLLPDSTYSLIADNMKSLPVGSDGHIGRYAPHGQEITAICRIALPDADYYASSRYIENGKGERIALLVSLYPCNALLTNQLERALMVLFGILIMVVAGYALTVFGQSVASSLRSYAKRTREGLPYAQGTLYPAFSALLCWLRDIDRYVLVFVVPCFAPGGTFTEIAGITATMLLCNALGSMVMTPFSKLAYARIGSRRTGLLASAVTIGAYGMILAALWTSSVSLFYAAKFLLGVTLGNVLSVLSNSVGACIKDKDLRREVYLTKQTVSNSAILLSILTGGYIVQYLNAVALYSFILVLSALLIVVCALSLPTRRQETATMPPTDHYWQDILESLRFLLRRDGWVYAVMVLLPSCLIFGFFDYMLPLFASQSGMSPLLLSNILIVGITLNLLTRDSLNRFYGRLGAKGTVVFYSTVIAACMILTVFSPTMVWLAVIALVIYVLRYNSFDSLYKTELIEYNGFRQQAVSSDFILLEHGFNAARMPFIQCITLMGRSVACASLGAIVLLLSAGLALLGRRT